MAPYTLALWALPPLPLRTRQRQLHHTSPHHALTPKRPRAPMRPFRQLRSAAPAPEPRSTPPAPLPAIRPLPREVVQRIAAGEVLRGLSCAVRELVENALDARAMSVRVDVDPALRALTCSDDGSGMDAAGIVCAAGCNATSKLRDVGGLDAVATLGFRGQGLWALAGVAGEGLVVMSRVGSEDAGVRVVFDGDGGVQGARRCAMGVGTIVAGVGLPWGCDAAEVREARQWLERATLVWPAVSFSLSVKGKVLWRSGSSSGDGADDAQAVFADFVGRPAADFRRAVVADESGLCGSVDVVVGVPARVHFGDGNRVVVAVNGRCVALPEVERCVRASYRAALPSRRYPAVFVRVTASRRGACDWNISPIKSTMRLRGVDLPALVARAIELALGSDFVVGGEDAGPHVSEGVLAAASAEAAAPGDPGAVVAALLARTRDARLAAAAVGPAPNETDGGDGLAGGIGLGMTSIKAVAQTLGTYILAEHNGSDLFLIEQHVAHERVLYEELVNTWSSSFVRLSADRVVTLPAAVASDDERLLSLSALGFELSHNDSSGDCAPTATVLTAPRAVASLSPADLAAAVRAVAADGLGANAGVDRAAASLACRAAVRNGAPLSGRAMDGLVQRLARCRNPHTCPHGRPVFVELGARDLAALFRRRYSPRARVARRRRARGML